MYKSQSILDEGFRSYDFSPKEYSQENPCSWLTFQDDTLILKPEKTLHRYGGITVWANERAGAVLKIPEDAEPGYHAALVGFEPELEERSRTSGVKFRTTSRSLFVFKVPGEAVRSLKVLGFNAERRSQDMVRIDTLVRNNGTVTVSAKVNDLKIIKNNETLAILDSPTVFIKPGEMKTISTYWSFDGDDGIYNIEGVVDWRTGSVIAEGKIRITPYYGPPVGKAEERKVELNILILPLLVVILISLYIYNRRR